MLKWKVSPWKNKYLDSTFEKVNNYPKYVINQLNRKVKLKHTENIIIERSAIDQTAQNEQKKCHLLDLPSAGNKGERILKSINKFSSRVSRCNVKICIAYFGTKLSSNISKFQSKDQTKNNHQHDVVYYAKCPEEKGAEDYTGETWKRLTEPVKQHNGKDLKSYLFKYLVEINYKAVILDDFKIIGKGYKRSKFRPKLAE